jgi:hypothetical protein
VPAAHGRPLEQSTTDLNTTTNRQESHVTAPSFIKTTTVEQLVEEISQRKGHHPKAKEVIIVGPANRAHDVLDTIAAGCIVERRYFTNGAWRIDTNEGVTVRHLSGRDGLRGRSADLVVVLDSPELNDHVFADASLVVLTTRGRVVAL